MSVKRIPYEGDDMRQKKVVPVVLVYLFGYVKGVPHVLLVRRGEHVAYMQNMWSTIAGVVNRGFDFVRQTLVEVAGETGLLQNEVSKPGKIGTFEDLDEANKKTWIRTLMFATVLKSANNPDELGVRLDWEHREAAWMPVSTVLEWLSGKLPEDPVAWAILRDEPQTPDFRLNLERARAVMVEKLSQ